MEFQKVKLCKVYRDFFVSLKLQNSLLNEDLNCKLKRVKCMSVLISTVFYLQSLPSSSTSPAVMALKVRTTIK